MPLVLLDIHGLNFDFTLINKISLLCKLDSVFFIYVFVYVCSYDVLKKIFFVWIYSHSYHWLGELEKKYSLYLSSDALMLILWLFE